MDAAPLALDDAVLAGDDGVVAGYPFGGPFTMVGAEVISAGSVFVPDIYGDSSALRDIYALAAQVQPGNSGGPLLTADGDVAGVVFARAERGQGDDAIIADTKLFDAATGRTGIRLQAALCALELLEP